MGFLLKVSLTDDIVLSVDIDSSLDRILVTNTETRSIVLVNLLKLLDFVPFLFQTLIFIGAIVNIVLPETFF